MNINLDEMTRAEKEAEIERLERILNIFQRSMSGWEERNRPENLEVSNALNEQIFQLNKSIGFTYYL